MRLHGWNPFKNGLISDTYLVRRGKSSGDVVVPGLCPVSEIAPGHPATLVSLPQIFNMTTFLPRMNLCSANLFLQPRTIRIPILSESIFTSYWLYSPEITYISCDFLGWPYLSKHGFHARCITHVPCTPRDTRSYHSRTEEGSTGRTSSTKMQPRG